MRPTITVCRRNARSAVVLAILTASLASSCSPGPTDPSVDAVSATTTIPTSPTSDTAPATGSETATVLQVVDGDTIVISIGGIEERVRLIGIDTPEIGDCLYDEAKQSLIALVGSREVRLVMDTTDRDRFDRLLRYVWVDDVFVNEAQVGSGLAVARRYPPDTAEADRLEAVEAAAKEAGIGRWAPEVCGELATSIDGSPSALRIDHVEYDAPGDDSLALNGEWVRIVNDGDAPVQLEGWQLRDDSSTHRYTVPPLELAPRATVTIYSGCGNDTTSELFWCNRGSAIWNNSGDTAYLIDPSGNTLTSFGY